jgi:hypothetical protein
MTKLSCNEWEVAAFVDKVGDREPHVRPSERRSLLLTINAQAFAEKPDPFSQKLRRVTGLTAL